MADSAPDFLGLGGRRILVTGASSGIGRATAIAASRQGAIVALLGRRRPELDETLALLEGTGHIVREFDLARTDAIGDEVAEIARRLGGIDGIAHAAGVHSSIPVRALDAAHVDELLHANVTATLMLARAYRSKAIPKTRGSLVIVSSVVATVGQPGVSAYAASKGALSALTRSVALEFVRDGIRVNAVEPGIVATRLTDELRGRVGEDAFAAIEAAHPLGIGTPENVAAAILFLLSDASSWITGTALVVDGGYTAQ